MTSSYKIQSLLVDYSNYPSFLQDVTKDSSIIKHNYSLNDIIDGMYKVKFWPHAIIKAFDKDKDLLEVEEKFLDMDAEALSTQLFQGLLKATEDIRNSGQSHSISVARKDSSFQLAQKYTLYKIVHAHVERKIARHTRSSSEVHPDNELYSHIEQELQEEIADLERILHFRIQDIVRSNDPVLLLRFISSYSHEAIETNQRFSQPTSFAHKFLNMKQDIDEKIMAFRERFEITLALAKRAERNLGIKGYTDSQLAELFRFQLHPKHSQYFAESTQLDSHYESPQAVIDAVQRFYLKRGQGTEPTPKHPTVFQTTSSAPAGKEWKLVNKNDRSKANSKDTPRTDYSKRRDNSRKDYTKSNISSIPHGNTRNLQRKYEKKQPKDDQITEITEENIVLSTQGLASEACESIILDTGSSIHVIHASFVGDHTGTTNLHTMSGSSTVNQADFYGVNVATFGDNSRANIFSPCRYILTTTNNGKQIHVSKFKNHEETLIFHRDTKTGFYMTTMLEFIEWFRSGSSQSTNMVFFTTSDIKDDDFDTARDLIANSGYPGITVAEKLLKKHNLPTKYARLISKLQPHIEITKGKGVIRHQSPTKFQRDLMPQDPRQILYIDLIFEFDFIWLIGLLAPLQLLLLERVDSKSTKDVRSALIKFIYATKARKYDIVQIISDSESAFVEIAHEQFPFAPWQLNQSKRGNPPLDVKVRHLKNIARCIYLNVQQRFNGPMPRKFIDFLFSYATTKANALPPIKYGTSSTPLENFTCTLTTAQDNKFPFMAIIEFQNPAPNRNLVCTPRTKTGLYLRPLGAGNHLVYDIETGRSLLRVLPTNNPTPEAFQQVIEHLHKISTTGDIEDARNTAFLEAGAQSIQQMSTVAAPTILDTHERCYNTLSVNVANNVHGPAASASIMAELKHLYFNHDCFTVVPRNLHQHVFQNKQVLRSSLFLKEKSCGRLKSRFVADGRPTKSQNHEHYSPTLANNTIFLLLKIAAVEKYTVSSLDVGSAYTNAAINEEIYMTAPKYLIPYFFLLDANIKNMTTVKGDILLRINRALYGLAQSGLLWHQLLKSKLKNLGYRQSSIDPCVFYTSGPKKILIGIYVDDILIIAPPALHKDVHTKFREIFTDIKINDKGTIPYIGLSICQHEDFSIKVSMADYTAELTKDISINKNTPADATFHNDTQVDNTPLTKSKREQFHTQVARLLYLSYKLRSDISVIVAYLTTRVNNPTNTDYKRLTHVLAYLKTTVHQSLYISTTGKLTDIDIFIDGSFSSHHQIHGQSGMVLQIGNTTVKCISKKQPVIFQNPFQVELCAVYYHIENALSMRDFLIEIGYETGPPTLYQDNNACIYAYKNSTLSTDHKEKWFTKNFIRNKLEFIRQLVSLDLIRVVYLNTKNHPADFMTKPMGGKLFFHFRDIIFGITSMPPFGGDVVCQVTYGTDNNPLDEETEPKMTHCNHQLPIGKNSN